MTKQAAGFQGENGDVRSRLEAQQMLLSIWSGAILQWDTTLRPPNHAHKGAPPPHTNRHKPERVQHCCPVTALVLANPPRKAARLWLSQEILPPHTAHSHFYLDSVFLSSEWQKFWYLPQAQTARLATKGQTPNLQARSHRLFTPERPSHKCLIKSASFLSWHIFYITAHFRLLAKPLSFFKALQCWWLQRAEARRSQVQNGNTGFARPLLKGSLVQDTRYLQKSCQPKLSPQCFLTALA